MSDHDKLTKAIAYMRQTIRILDGNLVTSGAENIERWKVILDAAEATLPKTKMVETWRVEFSIGGKAGCTGGFESRSDADVAVDRMTGHPSYSCVKVTGPHQQEVSAT